MGGSPPPPRIEVFRLDIRQNVIPRTFVFRICFPDGTEDSAVMRAESREAARLLLESRGKIEGFTVMPEERAEHGK